MRNALILSLVLFAVAAVWAQKDTGDDIIKVETTLVSVPVVVRDQNGRYIPNLTASNFSLFQDGKPQKIDFFAAIEEPINVALLIDTSQSTRPVLDDIKDSAKAFLKLLRSKDKAMVVAFDYETHILCPLTSDQELLRTAIKQAEIPPPGRVGTVMRDALVKTVTGAFRDLTGRKAIILLTDGKDVGSTITSPDLLYRLQETDALVYSVMFKTGVLSPQVVNRINRAFGGALGSSPPSATGQNGPLWKIGRLNEIAEEYLTKLSAETAGRFYSSKDGKLKETFTSIVEELRFQYRLGFYPPDADGNTMLHELKVKVDRPGSAVRARASYRVR